MRTNDQELPRNNSNELDSVEATLLTEADNNEL